LVAPSKREGGGGGGGVLKVFRYVLLRRGRRGYLGL